MARLQDARILARAQAEEVVRHLHLGALAHVQLCGFTSVQISWVTAEVAAKRADEELGSMSKGLDFQLQLVSTAIAKPRQIPLKESVDPWMSTDQSEECRVRSVRAEALGERSVRADLVGQLDGLDRAMADTADIA